MENFSPAQGIVSEIWKMSGNLGKLTHVREFCYRPFRILPFGIKFFFILGPILVNFEKGLLVTIPELFEYFSKYSKFSQRSLLYR